MKTCPFAFCTEFELCGACIWHMVCLDFSTYIRNASQHWPLARLQISEKTIFYMAISYGAMFHFPVDY